MAEIGVVMEIGKMKKTAIVSCYFQHNYGSMLQAYATQMVLDKLGYAIIKSIICVMVACAFHRTAVFEFAIILIAYLALKNKLSVVHFQCDPIFLLTWIYF